MNNQTDNLGVKAILFDLDDTLLSNDMDTFLQKYFRLLSHHAADRYEPSLLLKHLMAATEKMANNTDPCFTNEIIFWREFSRLTGFDPEEMIPFFTRFYETRFDEVRTVTKQRPEAKTLIKWAFDQGYQVVIATNPMFPRIAVERRLVWAGVPVGEFDYDLVTTYENMTAVKPHTEYYHEILSTIDRDASEALMVGDDWERDIVPAAGVGMKVYWISLPDKVLPDDNISLLGRGTLADLKRFLVDDAQPHTA